MTTTIKITALSEIGSNLATSTVVPVVNMAGTPTTQKTTVGNIANLALTQAGNAYPAAALATLAQTVTNAAQPNITSVGTLTGLTSTGDVTFTSAGNVNLGPVGNVKITGGSSGQILSTDGAGNLSWVNDSTTYGNSNVAAYLPTYTGNLSAGNASLGNLLTANYANIVWDVNANVVNAAYLYGDGGNVTNVSALVSGTVTNAAQPNITSVGTLTDLTMAGNIIPDANVTYNLGNNTNRWNNLYLSGNTIVLGDAVLTANANALIVQTPDGGNFVLEGNANTTFGNIVGVNLNGNNQTWLAGDGTFANINVPTVGNIATINLDGNAGNILYGNGAFAASPSVSLSGDGGNLSNINGANVNGIVANANITDYINIGRVSNNFSFHVLLSAGDGDKDIHVDDSDNLQYNPNSGLLTAVRVDAQNFVGNLFYSSGYAVANVDGIGNIATINLSGNGSQVLAGNGTWVAQSGGGNASLPLANGSSNINIATANGNVTITANASNTWTFGDDGNLVLAGGNSVIQSIANSSLDPTLPNVSTMTLTPDANYNSQVLVLDPTAPGHIHLRAYAFSNIDDPAANIFLGGEDTAFEITSGANNEARIHSGNNTWTFGNDGVLTTPGNIALSGGSEIQGSNNGLYITPNPNSLDDFIQISSDSGNEGIVIGTTGGITLQSDAGNRSWLFDNTGTLTAPGDITVAGDITGRAAANTLVLKAQPTTNTYIQLNSIVDSTIQTHANLEIVTDSSNTSQSWTFGTDGRLTFPGTPRIDTSANNFEVQAAENINFEASSVVNIYTDGSGNAYQWQFGDDSDLLTPGNIDFGNGSRAYITYGANNYISLNNDGGMDLSCNTEVKITTNYGDTPNRAYSYFYANGAFSTGPIVANGNISANNIGNISGINIDGSSSNVLYGNGVFASAPAAATVDITDTNGLTTTYYPTFVENRTTGQIVRADQDFTYRTDTNTLTVGNITGNTNGFTIGYLNIPQVVASNTTLVLSDAGKHYYSTTAGNLTVTIPNNATTSFATGTAINIVVQAEGNVLVNAASGVTLYLAGNSSAANRVVGTYGMATLLKVASDTWFINGTGVS